MHIPKWAQRLAMRTTMLHDLRMGISSKGGSILVVDDDEDSRMTIEEVLVDRGYSVVQARDGEQALELLRSSDVATIGAILLDLRMPRLSGWDLVKILKRDPQLSRIPIIVTSGVSVHGDASGIGATMHCLRKPFGMDELLSAVEACRDAG